MVRQLKTNFVSGELSGDLRARPDIKQYHNGAARLRNMVVLPQGGAQTRPGSKFIATVTDKAANQYSNTRLAPFQFSTEQAYLFVFAHLELKIYKDGVLQATLVTPWASDDLRAKFDAAGNIDHTGISWETDLDTMLVFHEDYAPRKIQRTGSHTSWAISTPAFLNVPRYRFGDGVYGQRITGGTVSFPIGAGSNGANLIDGNSATTGSNVVGATTGLTNIAARRIFQVDHGSVKTFGAIKALNASATNTKYLQVLYSSDGTTWFSYGIAHQINTVAKSFTWTGTFSARYVALAGPEGSAATYTLGSFDFYSDDVGVDEVQRLRLPNVTAAKAWTNNDVMSLLLQDVESDTFNFDSYAETMAIILKHELEKMTAIGVGNVSVVALDSNTDTNLATFEITFINAAGGKPWGALFVNVVSATNAPSFEITVYTEGRRPGEAMFSATRGYPRCGMFAQGRLWLGGMRSLPNYLLATRSGTIDDLNTESVLDDYGIAVAADTEDVPTILNMVSGRHVQIFTTAGEFYIPISEVDKVTPANIVLRRTSAHGSQPGLRVVDVEGGTLFVQRGGKAVREYVFSDTELAYQAANISLLSSDLVRNPSAMAIKRSASDEDANFIYLPNGDDGTMAVVSTLRLQEVTAFSLWHTNGLFHDVAVVLDKVYVAVQRLVSGFYKTIIEELDATLLTDSAVTGGAAATAAIGHLGTATVVPVIDGAIAPAVAIAAGSVDLIPDAATAYEVGLAWPVCDAAIAPNLKWFAQTMPMQIEKQDGPTFGRKMRLPQVMLRLRDTTALKVNNNRLSFQSLGDDLLDKPIAPFTGVRRIRGMLGWDFEGQIVLGADTPSRATILALGIGVSV